MNALARYLLVFLLGWSGAVWSYSDLIYKSNNASQKTKIEEKANDISLPKALKPLPTVSNNPSSENPKKEPPATTLNNTQTPENSD